MLTMRGALFSWPRGLGILIASAALTAYAAAPSKPSGSAKPAQPVVKIDFSLDDPQPHNIRKVRQAAGIAAAHGLPREAALAAMTVNPAEIFGVASRYGSIARGRPADLVLWSGDPLEVTTLADRVFIEGQSQPMQSRQTALRDRYLEKLRAHAAR
jgi:adenine deaminase